MKPDTPNRLKPHQPVLVWWLPVASPSGFSTSALKTAKLIQARPTLSRQPRGAPAVMKQCNEYPVKSADHSPALNPNQTCSQRRPSSQRFPLTRYMWWPSARTHCNYDECHGAHHHNWWSGTTYDQPVKTREACTSTINPANMEIHADMILELANPPMHISITTHAEADNTNAAVMITGYAGYPE